MAAARPVCFPERCGECFWPWYPGRSAQNSAGRALGLIIAKCKIIGGVSYDVFTKLYESIVSPVVEYGAAVWGTKNYACINAVQHRAGRFFLGVGKYTPNNAVMGDLGWFPIVLKQWKSVITNWCRLTNMDTNRVNKRVFLWADKLSLKHKCVKNWNYFVRKNFIDLDFNHFSNSSFNFDKKYVVHMVISKMFDNFMNTWKQYK